MEYRKRTISGARKIQQHIKKEYGFKPSIYRERNPFTGSQSYVVVKAKGMKKIR
jgi:hypothetical protein